MFERFIHSPLDRLQAARWIIQQIWVEESHDWDWLTTDELAAIFEFVTRYPRFSSDWDTWNTSFEYSLCQEGCDRFLWTADTSCTNCNGCESCCTCHACEGCSVHVSSVCETCDQCENCCECTYCESCDRPRRGHHCDDCSSCSSCCSCQECARCRANVNSDSICDDCSRCNECCRCTNLDTRSARTTPWLASEQHEFKIKRLVGVEWEFNSTSNGDPIQNWAQRWGAGIHTDGSCGWEAVTPPIAGDHIERCLTELGEAFERGDTDIDSRCGIHVHVDVRDFYWEDMFRLMRVHAHIEPLLYVLAGQKRMRNDYSRPASEIFSAALGSLDRKDATLAIAVDHARGGRNLARCKIEKKSGGRYRALNIIPWLARHRRGKGVAKDVTVEYRMHRDWKEPERVIGWVQLLVRIVDWVSRASHREAERVCSVSALRAISIMAPESVPYVLERISKWRHDLPFRRSARRLVRFNTTERKWQCVG